MTMAAPPLHELFPAKRTRQPSGDAGGAGVVLTDEARVSLGKQPHPGTYVAD
jgi:hypothetical protein